MVNISSTFGLIPAPFCSLYGATKAFVRHFSKSVRYEYRYTNEPFYEHIFTHLWKWPNRPMRHAGHGPNENDGLKEEFIHGAQPRAVCTGLFCVFWVSSKWLQIRMPCAVLREWVRRMGTLGTSCRSLRLPSSPATRLARCSPNGWKRSAIGTMQKWRRINKIAIIFFQNLHNFYFSLLRLTPPPNALQILITQSNRL